MQHLKKYKAIDQPSLTLRTSAQPRKMLFRDAIVVAELRPAAVWELLPGGRWDLMTADKVELLKGFTSREDLQQVFYAVALFAEAPGETGSDICSRGVTWHRLRRFWELHHRNSKFGLCNHRVACGYHSSSLHICLHDFNRQLCEQM